MNNINKTLKANVSFSPDLRPGYSAADAAQLTDAVQHFLANPMGLLTISGLSLVLVLAALLIR